MISRPEQQPSIPTIFTIFGITGDLSRRKLLPAMYHLYCHNLLPKDIQYIGVAMNPLSPDEFRQLIAESIHTFGNVPSLNKDQLNAFTALFRYVSGDVTKAETYTQLRNAMTEVDTACNTPHQAIFYLAVSPQFFIPIINALDEHELTQPCKQFNVKGKIVIEKPFGEDATSAQALNEAVLKYADEEQIYRMDHYLGKETVQNMLLFRFTNPIINDSWKPEAIERIEITANEDLGVEQRIRYYDNTGALRDMIQSHCLALLTLALMDEPRSLTSADIHARKEDMLKTITLASDDIAHTAMRARYDGYERIPDVRTDSITETFAALRLKTTHDKWKNVPLFIKTGKRLEDNTTKIKIFFSPCKSNICKAQGIKTEPNILTIRIQPQEGISLTFYAKKPGFDISTEEVDMSFFYEGSFQEEQPSPYERLIFDVIVGDQSLFPSTAEVMEQWRIIQPVIDAWKSNDLPLLGYEQGSQGPTEIDSFMDRR